MVEPTMLEPVWLSLRLSLITVLILLLIGLPLAWWLAMHTSLGATGVFIAITAADTSAALPRSSLTPPTSVLCARPNAFTATG